MGVSQKTLRGYFEEYKNKGIEGLRELKFYRPQTEMMEYKGTIEEMFREQPPATLKEASSRIYEITGIQRDASRVGVFLKKNRIETFENGANTGQKQM